MSKRNLSNWLRAYMEFTRDTEPPEAYHFWTGCFVLSAITKRQLWLDFHQFQIYPNLYVIIVGPPGGRKGAATNIGMGIAKSAGVKTFSDKITAAALIRDLSNSTEKRITYEKSEVALCSPLTIYSPELGVFMGPDAYGSGVIADLTDLYDCPASWEKKTISRDSELIVAPFVSFLAATTPQTLKDCIPASAVGQGFTSRIMFIYGSGRRKKIPIPTWGSEYEMLKKNLIADLIHIGSLTGEFKFSDNGLIAYKKYYLESAEPEEEFEDERLRGYAARKGLHMLKLSMILSLAASDSLLITETEIKGALDAIKWMESGLANVFAGHGSSASSQDVVRVFRQISNASAGYISAQELTKRNYANLSAAELSVVLDTLKQAEAISEFCAHDPRSNKISVLFKVRDQSFIKEGGFRLPKQLEEK